MRNNKKIAEHIARKKAMKTPFTVEQNGIKLTIQKDVYPVGELSYFFTSCMESLDFREKFVWDYGCGAGNYGIKAALLGAKKILFSDINPHAVECAKYNANQNDLKGQLEFRVGKNLEVLEVNEQFDVICAGMPWDNDKPTDWVEYAFFDELFQMRHSLFANGQRLLKPGGFILSSLSEEVKLRNPDMMPRTGYKVETLATKIIHGQKHEVYKFSF